MRHPDGVRHIGSLLLAAVFGPAIFLLTGTGLSAFETARSVGFVKDPFAALAALGALLLAGLLYGILAMARLSPLGPGLVGMAYLGMSGWGLLDNASYEALFGKLDVHMGGAVGQWGLGFLLGVPLVATLTSPRRWRKNPHPTPPPYLQYQQQHPQYQAQPQYQQPQYQQPQYQQPQYQQPQYQYLPDPTLPDIAPPSLGYPAGMPVPPQKPAKPPKAAKPAPPTPGSTDPTAILMPAPPAPAPAMPTAPAPAASVSPAPPTAPPAPPSAPPAPATPPAPPAQSSTPPAPATPPAPPAPTAPPAPAASVSSAPAAPTAPTPPHQPAAPAPAVPTAPPAPPSAPAAPPAQAVQALPSFTGAPAPSKAAAAVSGLARAEEEQPAESVAAQDEPPPLPKRTPKGIPAQPKVPDDLPPTLLSDEVTVKIDDPGAAR